MFKFGVFKCDVWSLMFLEIGKVHHREFEAQKNYSMIFSCPDISYSMYFLYFLSGQP